MEQKVSFYCIINIALQPYKFHPVIKANNLCKFPPRRAASERARLLNMKNHGGGKTVAINIRR